MSLPIELLKRDSLKSWVSSSSRRPDYGACYSAEEQVRKEREVDSLMKETDRSIPSMNKALGQNKQQLLAVRSRVQRSMVQLLHSFGCVIDGEIEESFTKATDDFIRQAYDFDRDITQEAVYQASRNVLIMNTVQMHLGKNVSVTPSVFAYSMLYPYTDNYLDAADIGRDEKQEANRWLRRRLAGTGSRARGCREEKIDALVEMVEGEFDRRRFPRVYDSLLAIHAAQCRSVSQQGRGLVLLDDELLDISIEKGGTSVLADGYLVAGELGPGDERFLFQFGVLLQLIDDLQDVGEDAGIGQATLAGTAALGGCAEEYTNRLFGFNTEVLNSSTLQQQRLHRLIDRSCRLLLLEAVAANPRYYGAGYCSMLEGHSPVRLKYLRSVKDRLHGVIDTHKNKVGTHGVPTGFIQSSDPTEIGRPERSAHQRHLPDAYERRSSNSLLGVS